jgi:hypothetical protein
VQQVLMEMIAREKRFLDLVVRIQCADGVEIHASARRDTGPTPMSCFRVGRDPEEEKRVLGICRRPLVNVSGGNRDIPVGAIEVTVAVPARQLNLAQECRSEDRCSRLADPVGGCDPPMRLPVGLPALLLSSGVSLEACIGSESENEPNF